MCNYVISANNTCNKTLLKSNCNLDKLQKKRRRLKKKKREPRIMDWKQISTSQSLFYCPSVFTNAAGFKQTGRDTLVQRSSWGRDGSRQTLQQENAKKVAQFLISRYLFHYFTAFRGTPNQTIAFFTMCLNPVHRRRVCEKLYHKMGYERKKKKTG